MPRYDYKCPKCERMEEATHGANEPFFMYCVECAEEMVKQLGTFSGFNFKGSGFFRNDYPRNR